LRRLHDSESRIHYKYHEETAKNTKRGEVEQQEMLLSAFCHFVIFVMDLSQKEFDLPIP
jgi:hypothetical protein